MMIYLRFAACCLLAVSALHGAAAQPLVAEPSAASQNSPNLADRFADVPNFQIDTPAFAPKKSDFTTDAELQVFLARRIAPFAQVTWKTLGKTAGGRDIHILVFTQDGRGDAISVAANRKPTVWLIGQQHGNEPAGAEALLEVARRLVATDLKQMLEKVNVVMVPRANPDGGATHKRETLKGDMNRDHLLTTMAETQMLHNALDAYPPAVVVDLHEFTASGRWVERFGVSQASDILVQSASHPAIAEAIKKMTKDVFDPALQAAWSLHNLRSFAYHTLNIQGNQTFVQMGGNFAGIGRNAFGFYGAVSYLLESRGVGIGRDNYQRRVASHVISAAAILKTAAKHVDDLKLLQRDVRKLATNGSDWLVDHTTKRELRNLPMYDPVTGEDKSVKVEFQNSFAITPTLTRSLPLGYILPANHPAAAKLRALGINVHRLVSATELDVETYSIKELRQDASEFGAPELRISTETKRSKKQFEAGSLWVPITVQYQPLWRIAMVALEPEGVGSFANYKLFGEASVGNDLSLVRVIGLQHGSSNALQSPVLD